MSKQTEYVGKKRNCDKSHLTWDDTKQAWEGVVYSYTLDKPDDPKDGWKYIGCTPEQSTRMRMWGREKNKYGGKKIAEARKNYGIKSFSYQVLETLYDPDIDKLVEKLEDREKHFIQVYDSVENGFNGNYGGTGCTGLKLSKEEIEKRLKAKTVFKHTEETKKRIGEKLKGRKVSAETKEKISAGNKGKKRTKEMNQKQSQRMKGVNPVAATEGAKKWVAQNGGGYWKGKKMPNESIAKMKIFQQTNGTAVRAINVKDGSSEDFPTMLDASKKTGDGTGSVKYSMEHGCVTKRGYRYEKIVKP